VNKEFDYPEKEIWLQREAWIDKILAKSETLTYEVGDHSTALFMDMRLAYCSGAWLSVIIMSVSVIDAHLRETVTDSQVGTAKLLSEYYTGEDINWLRILRNKYVHVDVENPILGMNAWFDNRKELEENATKAMEMTVKAFF
jgi:hypothetical protein